MKTVSMQKQSVATVAFQKLYLQSESLATTLRACLQAVYTVSFTRSLRP